MGVSELWSILDPVRKTVPLYSLAGKTFAVDLSLWVCEAQHVQGMMGKVTKPHLRNLFFRVSSLTLMGVKLVFVMEGDAPKIKAETMSKRTEMRYGHLKTKSAPKPAPAKNTSRGRFKAVLRECAEMLDCLGVPWVTAAGEAEAMCAFLDSQGIVDGCITNDGDAFLYGAQTVYRNFNMNTKDPQVDCYQMSRVQADLGLDRETLVGLAIFLGCDYIPKGVAGVGKEQTLKLIQNLKGQALLQKFSEWGSDGAERSEVAVKKVTHCLVCRHPGSAKSHERSGCVFCKSERFCSPQDYDSHCPCEWHRTEHARHASSIEANIRKKTLACKQFPFTEIINEFLVMKDKPVQPFCRRKPNLLLMQNFALEKMDWPKHYSSEKILVLMTYTELMNRKHGRETSTQIEPVRIYKSRIKNGISCFEVVWKKPDHYVFAESCEEQTEVRTVEEESLFSLAYPHIVQDFHRERAEAQGNRIKKKKPNAKKEKPVDSHDAVSDLFAQMSLQAATDHQNSDALLRCRSTHKPNSDVTAHQQQTLQPHEIPTQRAPSSPTSAGLLPPAQSSPSVSALIGQLHLSSIDWDSSSFTASPSQQPQCSKTDLRSAENATEHAAAPTSGLNAPQWGVERSLKERLIMKNIVRSTASTDPVVQTQKSKSSESKLSEIKCSRTESNQPIPSKSSLASRCIKTQPACCEEKTSTNLKHQQTLTDKHSQALKNPLISAAMPHPGHSKPSENIEKKPQTVCKMSVCASQRPISDDSDSENRPRSQKPSRPVKTSPTHLPRVKKSPNNHHPDKTPEKHAVIKSDRLILVHHGKVENDDSDVSVDSPRPLAERLKMRFAK
ncbi:flap endonuclease GEN homolog 1 isoform X2 [Myxocyprinus asiaticus]|nr:flap endonuclease GEN homolog 1 isoform X2 [Myxocyprinus asiaticus]XP_051546520.1 flap endonuclease GEN homolog 1 isoform X2 [Myxocyprinus asiaticus]